MTIYKYPLAVTDRQTVEIPEGAELLCVQLQNMEPMLWAKVDPARAKVPHNILTFGTGNPIPEGQHQYISTYQTRSGMFVWHVFLELA